MHERLVGVLREHLPRSAMSCEAAASILLRALEPNSSNQLRLYDSEAELARLDEIERAMRTLQREMPLVPLALQLAHGFEPDGRGGGTHPPTERTLDQLAELKRWVDGARRTAPRGVRLGRADVNVRAVLTADHCAWFWEMSTGRQPPQSLNAASPFGRLLQAALDVVGAGDARSAVRALNRTRVRLSPGACKRVLVSGRTAD